LVRWVERWRSLSKRLFLGRAKAGSLALLLAACSPTFDWREARLAQTPLVALLPCKPDRATRTVPLAGVPVQMSMMGCEAGGVNFTVAVVDLDDGAKAASVMAQWRAATLANFSATQPQARAYVPKGAQGLSESVMLTATGKQADGHTVMLQAAWFARGTQAFQALAYADKVGAEVAETFFTSLVLQ
jgi:hypothetical protein